MTTSGDRPVSGAEVPETPDDAPDPGNEPEAPTPETVAPGEVTEPLVAPH